MIDDGPVRGGVSVVYRGGPHCRRTPDGALAINRRLAEADCWSDAMPFPGADVSPGIGHRRLRGRILSGWDAVPGADAGSQGGASETQGGLPWADLFCPVGAGVDEAVRRRDVAGRVAAGYSTTAPSGGGFLSGWDAVPGADAPWLLTAASPRRIVGQTRCHSRGGRVAW